MWRKQGCAPLHLRSGHHQRRRLARAGVDHFEQYIADSCRSIPAVQLSPHSGHRITPGGRVRGAAGGEVAEHELLPFPRGLLRVHRAVPCLGAAGRRWLNRGDLVPGRRVSVPRTARLRTTAGAERGPESGRTGGSRLRRGLRFSLDCLNPGSDGIPLGKRVVTVVAAVAVMAGAVLAGIRIEPLRWRTTSTPVRARRRTVRTAGNRLSHRPTPSRSAGAGRACRGGCCSSPGCLRRERVRNDRRTYATRRPCSSGPSVKVRTTGCAPFSRRRPWRSWSSKRAARAYKR